ncbi:MAG: hypothetical protein QME68_03885 [Elusimicrobiota bacterium]|nr:hypothetical protein [Elusimicrobiota bacterium]
MILEEPDLTGNKQFDAYLAALAEYLAIHYNLEIPQWIYNPEKLLNKWWFPSKVKSWHPIALVQSPAPFRIRGIFIDDSELVRV